MITIIIRKIIRFYLYVLPLLILFGCTQPVNEGAGGARFQATCYQIIVNNTPTHQSCIDIITNGATTSTPTMTPSTTLSVPVSALPTLP